MEAGVGDVKEGKAWEEEEKELGMLDDDQDDDVEEK